MKKVDKNRTFFLTSSLICGEREREREREILIKKGGVV